MPDHRIVNVAAESVLEAREALDRVEFSRAHEAYLRASSEMLVVNELDNWADLIGEHIGHLQEADQVVLAMSACHHYVSEFTRLPAKVPPQVKLRVQVYLAVGYAQQRDWSECRNVVDSLSEAATALTGFDSATVLRLQGLIAFHDERDAPRARKLLEGARLAYKAIDMPQGVDVVVADLRNIGVVEGDAGSIEQVLAAFDPTSPIDRLAVSKALRRKGDYEGALGVLVPVDQTLLDPPLLFEHLYQMAYIHRLGRNYKALDLLIPRLREVTSELADSERRSASVERLVADPTAPAPASAYDGGDVLAQIHKIRADLFEANSTPAATSVDGGVLATQLDQLSVRIRSTEIEAFVALAQAEANLLAFRQGSMDAATKAAAAAQEALALAERSGLHDVASTALRTWGNLQLELGSGEGFSKWQQAFEIDEAIASRFASDQRRIEYLVATPDAFDGTVEHCARRALTTYDPGDIAACAVAIEAARGAAILRAITPNAQARLRELPSVSRPDECLHWLLRTAELLDRDQAVWMMHAHPDAVFHVVIAPNQLEFWVTPADSQRIVGLTQSLLLGRSAPRIEEVAVADEQAWSDQLTELADSVGYEDGLSRLSESVQRLSIIAGGALGDIPFLALPLSSQPGGLLRRYALSELPCLAALRPLRRRAARVKGTKTLRVAHALRDGRSEIVGDELTTSTRPTASAVRSHLESGKWQVCRLHCHGEFSVTNARHSQLVVAPGPEAADLGYISAGDLEKYGLAAVGVLALGSCESGMAQLRGRDETEGFVRASFVAGCCSVLAAKFKAHQLAAEPILDEFEARLAFERKDEALRSAVLSYLDAAHRAPGVENPEHPLRWACWSLHGDAGYQTGSGAIVRRRQRTRFLRCG